MEKPWNRRETSALFGLEAVQASSPLQRVSPLQLSLGHDNYEKSSRWFIGQESSMGEYVMFYLVFKVLIGVCFQNVH